MADNPLFRKTALDKLASPERLDVLMQVTSPQGWIALWTIGIVLAIAVGWSVLGRIGERVNGQGLLIRSEGNRSIRASGAGRLSSLLVRYGQEVVSGELIGKIEVASVDDRIKIAEAEYENLKRENARRSSEDRVQSNTFQQQVRELQDRRKEQQRKLEARRIYLEERGEMLKKGTISRREYEATDAEVSNLEGEVLRAGQQIDTIQSNTTAVGQRVRTGDTSVAEALLRLQKARSERTNLVNVTSAFSGRVMTLPKREGDVVQANEVIAAIEETAAPLQAALLVSDREGPRIKKGMTVQLDLTPIVRREQYGVLLGTVTSVGQYAATAEEVQSVIANVTQTQEILRSGSKFLVRVALVPASNTKTGFAWSSSSGPSEPIAGGMTISSGAVIVESRRPVCRVLPIDRLCAS
jgi:HlyD family secretion protein